MKRPKRIDKVPIAGPLAPMEWFDQDSIVRAINDLNEWTCRVYAGALVDHRSLVAGEGIAAVQLAPGCPLTITDQGIAFNYGDAQLNHYIASVAGSSTGSGIAFGKPTSAYSGGATITLAPCTADGSSTGGDNITVTAGWPMPDGCTIATSQIIPLAAVGTGYAVIGNYRERVGSIRLYDNTGSNQIVLQYKKVIDWGTFFSTEATDWTDAGSALTTGPFECPP
jgi:hypothetical protein